MRRLWIVISHLLIIQGLSHAETQKLVRQFNANRDFAHATGRIGSKGWQVDYRQDRPGYVIKDLQHPLLLEEGLYRFNVDLRRGYYPNKGLFHKTFGLFRVEIWDITKNEILISHEYQIGDFSKPNHYQTRWLEFSTEKRQGHIFEPRVFWIGLGNGEVGDMTVERFVLPSLKELEEKAYRLGDRQEGIHIENGFVVSRKMSGEADETGDATTYTGFYAASLAWKYAVTKDPFAYQALENALTALHNAIKGDAEHPILTRFVEQDGTPFPKVPSKDVYTSFFLAYAAAYPHIRNTALKNQMEDDVDRIVTQLLLDGLVVKSGEQSLLCLTPYFTETEVRDGIQKFLSDKKAVRDALKGLRKAKTYLPFTELWPGIGEAVKAIRSRDENRLFRQVVPTMNGVLHLLIRIREMLREQYRDDLFPRRIKNLDYPGKRLLELINGTLKKLPPTSNMRRFHQLSDMRILASNALLSLHIIRSAIAIAPRPHFEEFYRTNLFTQQSLLKTAVDWYAIEEDFIKTTAGNPIADQHRRGYLTTLALTNLIQLEKNVATKDQYKSLLEREWKAYQREDNPMMVAVNAMAGHTSQINFILRDLGDYPEDRVGYGKDFWAKEGSHVADEYGGGEYKGYARESLPVSVRPKDSFLWQRNARRLSGDEVKEYPATDYLFVYWFARFHELIPATPADVISLRAQ